MRHLILILLILLSASPAFAGIAFEIETKDHSVSPARLERTVVQADGQMLKMTSVQATNSNVQPSSSDAVIYRSDRSELTIVDHQRKNYMVIDRQFVANLAGQLAQMAGQAQGMLENVPPAQRGMVEQMMKQRMPTAGQAAKKPNIQVSNTGNREQVYGYPCVLFQVTRDGRKVRDVWVTQWNNVSGGRELAGTFDSMSSFVQELTSALPMQAESPMQDNAFATIKQMGGFPVATREYRADGSVASESALRSARQMAIDHAAFQPPQGYRPQSMFGNAGGRNSGFGNAGSVGAAPSSLGRYPKR